MKAASANWSTSRGGDAEHPALQQVPVTGDLPVHQLRWRRVCNYCHSYKPKGLTVDKRPQFEEILKKYRRDDGKQGLHRRLQRWA
ncbi:MAG: hypothetical protein IPF64_04765 [Flavobacteriales bacterium]|nr:hypothetical protein [Flavobacteriales bacterium]